MQHCSLDFSETGLNNVVETNLKDIRKDSSSTLCKASNLGSNKRDSVKEKKRKKRKLTQQEIDIIRLIRGYK